MFYILCLKKEKITCHDTARCSFAVYNPLDSEDGRQHHRNLDTGEVNTINNSYGTI